MTLITNGLKRGLFSILLLCFIGSAQAASTSMLWKAVAPNGKVSYLFGTMHTDDARVNELAAPVVSALNESQVFMMEVLPGNDPTLYQMKNQNLKDLLTHKEWEQVKTLADFHYLNGNMAMHMKPWLMAMTFDLPKPASDFALDNQLLSMAEDQDKDVLALEDTTKHFELLDDLTMDQQLTMLRAVLKRTQAQKERDYQALVKAYLTGDPEKTTAIDEKLTAGILPKELWSKMRVKLLDERNQQMTARIVDQGTLNSLFVAVGAAHLPGNSGLITLLKNAGYQVEPVSLETAVVHKK
ncbi:MAG: TraB/GumN family protein [Methylophilaceae bacterium]|nr:TraB/GumN family protein [Methyloradius sp.]